MEKEKCNLLIADDEIFVVEWMEKIVGECLEYRIYSATTSQEAMKIIRNTDIQVALLDMCMPEIGGLEMLKYLRKLRPNCQVVFLSGYSNFDYIYDAMKYEGVRYLLKVENDQTILSEIEHARLAYEIKMNPSMEKEETIAPQETLVINEYVNQAPIVILIKKYIDEHLEEDLQLTTLADRFHFNPSYLSRLFKNVTGVNLSDYIFSCRMEESKKLLGNEYIKVEEVARKVGYQSAKSFSRLFKRFQGVTPQMYRDSVQRNQAYRDVQK